MLNGGKFGLALWNVVSSGGSRGTDGVVHGLVEMGHFVHTVYSILQVEVDFIESGMVVL